MFTKFILPLVAFLLLVFAVKHVVDARKPDIPSPPPIEPPKAVFKDNVAGAGMIEAQTENIEIGAPVPGIAIEVPARVSQKVKTGDVLFRVDDRQMQAELKVRQANVFQAEADLNRLENQPRPEQMRIRQAQVTEASAALADARDQYTRGRQLTERKAITAGEMFQREQAFRSAEARHERATAEYELEKAGAWEYDILVAKAALEQAQAQVTETKTQIERHVVRALVPGEVLQVNVRPGEYVAAPSTKSLIMLGNVQQLHVRVDISEYDINRFNADAPAVAMPKGQPQVKYPLKLVRIEPFVVPKKSLTGENTERVDTRVLQVIYALEPAGKQLFVGQQLDVYIQADDAMLKKQIARQ
jgi:multidrug resistance efflux pump